LSFSGLNFEASILASGGTLHLASTDGTAYFFGSNPTELAHEELAHLIEDRNGNQINIADSGNGVVTYTDTAGRTLLSTSGFGASGNTVTVSGLPGPYTITWGSTSFNWGGNGGWTLIKYNGIGLCNAPPSTSATVTAISAIQLPNGKKYTFTYDSTFGHLSKITYPTGGYVSYTWSINPQSVSAYYPDSTGDPSTPCLWRWGMPAITKRLVSYDGTTVAEEQDLSYSTPSWSTNQNTLQDWTQKQTVVTTKDLIRGTSFVTTYLYSPASSGEPGQPFEPGPPPVDIFVPVESTITYQNTGGTTLRTVNKTWLNAQQLSTEQDTLNDGASPITSQTTYAYDSGNQLHEKDEYDFGQSSPTRQTIINHQSFPATPLYTAGPSIFDLPCQVIVNDNTSGTSVLASETDYFYDNGSTSTPCGTAGTPSVTGVTSLTGHDETNYGPSGTAPRGNITQKTVVAIGGTSPVTTYTYDESGQLTSVTDPCGNATCSDMTGTNHTTTYSYADSFSSGTPSGTTNAYLTGISLPTTATGVTQTRSFTYALADGQLTSSTDENGQVTSYKYNTPPSGCSTSDGLDRLSEIDSPDTGKTTYCYNDTAPSPSVTTTKLISSTLSLSTTAVSDGMGHLVQSQLTSDPEGTDFTDTNYDGLGHVRTRSNPHRSASASTDGTTTYTYDSLGRTTQVSEPDGSTVTTAYAGNQTTVTDEAGNQRTSQSDALGRITKVFEAPNQTGFNFETDYQYDVLNNLICAVQKGTDTTAFSSCSASPATWRPRSFVYDSLSRLTSATNPESGKITYTYDVNRNLSTKKYPQPNQTGTATTTATYQYDALNRLFERTFNPWDGVDYYEYDGMAEPCPGPAGVTLSGATNLIGRRSGMCRGGSATRWSYDSMGRPIAQKTNHMGTVTESMSYSYNLDGSLKTITYPSGDLVTYTTSGAGRTTNVSDSINNFVAPPANPPMYTASGLLAGMKDGTAITTANTYNDRLQPATLKALASSATLMSLGYNFHLGSGDNGNVFGITNNDTTRSTVFTYDPLNRIQQANTVTTTGTNCWGEVYTIDAWGNLTNRSGVSGMTGCATEGLSQVASVKNQLGGLTYDAAGNVINDGNGNTPTYNAKNMISTVAGVTYNHDSDDRRIEKSSGTFYWLGASGDILAESNLSGTINEEYIFFNGYRTARIDRPSGTVHYYFSNHLGSHTLVTSATGACEQDIEYYPYGGVVADHCPNVAQHYKFTGKERDTESGLDNFGARYDASSLGRFMTPDPKFVGKKLLSDPQDLTHYSYTVNNPLRYIDPDGRDWETAWADVKAFANSLYTKVSVGAGVGGTAKVGTGEAKLEVSYKNTIEINTSHIALTQSVQASAEAGSKGGPSIGKEVGAEQTVRSVNSDHTVTGPDAWHSETTSSAGAGGASASSSSEQVGIGIEEGAGLLGGIELGSTRAGLSSLADAVSNVKDELILPQPPAPPVPGPPDAGPVTGDLGDAGKKAPPPHHLGGP